MEITELTLRLLLLFFPGIVCHLIVDALTVHRERTSFRVFFHAYVFGIASYAVFAVLASIASASVSTTDGIRIPLVSPTVFSTSVSDTKSPLQFGEILAVTILSVLLGLGFAFLINRKLIHRLATWMHITKKFPDPNLWTYVFDSDDTRWAVVRDREKNVMFQGYVRGFSDVDIDGVAELFLLDVIAYNEATGEELYRVDRMYLARPSHNLTIEFPSEG